MLDFLVRVSRRVGGVVDGHTEEQAEPRPCHATSRNTKACRLSTTALEARKATPRQTPSEPALAANPSQVLLATCKTPPEWATHCGSKLPVKALSAHWCQMHAPHI